MPDEEHDFLEVATEEKFSKQAVYILYGWTDKVIDLVSDAEDDEKALEDDDDDDDDIAHDPEICAMWERGEHTCTMFDAPCAVCEKDDEEDEEVDH